MAVVKKKRREDVLAEDTKLLEGYVKEFWNFLPLPICDINGAFIIINADKKFVDFLGYEPEEIMSMGLDNIFKDKDRFEQFREEVIEKRTISGREEVVLTKSGKEIPVSIFSQAREIEGGIVISYFLAFIDMSEVKKAYTELRKKIDELEKFHKLAVGRELKMIDLKNEIGKLKENKKESSGSNDSQETIGAAGNQT